MKKKVLFIVSIILLFIFCFFLIFEVYKKSVQRKKRDDEIREKLEREQRYNEIRESIAKAMDWHIRASFVIRDEYHCKGEQRSTFSSQFLINYGFLKQEEMLDVDGKSYCKARIEKYIEKYSEKYMDEDCTMKYDIYLSCKDYEDEGYYDLGF